MEQISLSIFLNNQWINVTEFISDTVNRANYYDVTFDTATISLLLKEDSIPGVDSSADFLPGTPCYIRYHNEAETVFYRLDEDNSQTLGSGQYRRFKHVLNLIEPGNELRFTKIPNMSFTQPVPDIVIRTDNYRILKSEYTTNSAKGSSPYGIVTKNESFDIIKDNQAQDGIVLNANSTYDISVDYKLINKAFDSETKYKWPSDISVIRTRGAVTETKFYLNLKKTTNHELYENLFSSEEIELPGGEINKIRKSKDELEITQDYTNWYVGELTPYVKQGTLHYHVKPTQDVYLELVQETGQNTFRFTAMSRSYTDVTATERPLDTDVTIRISEIEEYNPDENRITLAAAVEKVLKNINYSKTLQQPVRYTLDELTKGRISATYVSDMQLVNYSAWDALIKLAAEVEAIPYLTGRTFSTVKFLFRDEQPIKDINKLLIVSEESNINKEDYVKGYSVEIDNLVPELNISSFKQDPPGNIYSSVRVEDPKSSQLTEDNAVYILRDNIYDKHRFLFKGPNVILKASGQPDKTISDNTGKGYWDLTDYILEEKEWLSLSDYAITTNQDRKDNIRSKGNRLYYTKGTNIIKGLGYRAKAKPGILTPDEQTYPALTEIFIQAAINYNDDNDYTFKEFTNYDPTKDLFTGFNIKAIYPTVTNTNINIYKYNAEQMKLDRLFSTSTSDYQTSVKKLSKYLTLTLNEKGNMDYMIDGLAKATDKIPDVGDRLVFDNKEYKVNVQEITYGNTFNRYTLILSENLVNQNTNVGLNDSRRTFEIADNNIVERTDKFRTFIKLVSNVNNDNIKRNDNIDYNKYRTGTISNEINGKLILSKHSIPILDRSTNLGISSAFINITPSILDQDIRFIMPVNSFYLNTTMVFETEFIDNYSAGTFIETVPGSPPFKGSNVINYTDFLGNISKIDYRLMATNSLTADADKYPITNTVWTNTEATRINLSYNPMKDSREKLKLQAEVTYISQDPKYTLVFPALAKYSPLLDKSRNNLGTTDVEITYAYLHPSTRLSFNDSILDMSNVILTEEDIIGASQETLSITHGRYIDNSLTTSPSEANAEIFGIKIPYHPSNKSLIAVYNKNTLEVLFYHRMFEDENVNDLSQGELWFVPYVDTMNYVDELSLKDLGPTDINVTFRHNPFDISNTFNQEVFNVNKLTTLNNMLLYPHLYTSNVEEYPLPDRPYILVNRNTKQEISGDDIIYNDLSVDLVYQWGYSLSKPIVKSVIKDVCGEISLEVYNPNDNDITIEIDYKNGEDKKQYFFPALSTATLQPVTGFIQEESYAVELQAIRNIDTDPLYTSDSEITIENIKLPTKCTMRLKDPSFSLSLYESANNLKLRVNVQNFNNIPAVVKSRLTINGNMGYWTGQGNVLAFGGKEFDTTIGNKNVSYNIKVELMFEISSGNSNIVSDTIKHTILVWDYYGPATGPCLDPGMPMIGRSCTIEGKIANVAGYNDGYQGCIQIKCTEK